MTTDALLSVALRTAGRLQTRGVFTHAQAAEFVEWAMGRYLRAEDERLAAWRQAMLTGIFCDCGQRRAYNGNGLLYPCPMHEAVAV